MGTLAFRPLCLNCGTQMEAVESLGLASEGGSLRCGKCGEEHDYSIAEQKMTVRRVSMAGGNSGPAEQEFCPVSGHQETAPAASTSTAEGSEASLGEKRVVDIVADQLGGKDQITRETSFVNDLGADSLDTVELVMELEEEFDINIPDDVAEKIQTVGQAIDHIAQAIQSSETSSS